MLNPSICSLQFNDDEEERRNRRSVASTSEADDSVNLKMYLQMYQDNVSWESFSMQWLKQNLTVIFSGYRK